MEIGKLVSLIRSRYGKLPQGERLLAELSYAYSYAESFEPNAIEVIKEALWPLEEKLLSGAFSMKDVNAFEKKLASLGKRIKKQTIECVGHAHIDLNWQWSYDETVAATLATFGTMLQLMKEYPDFTFAQSQAVLYEIVQKYDPKMLSEIKRRVRQGRWEVTASAYVECDDNMPSGESLLTQIELGKRSVQNLFGIDPAEMKIYFVPDTFGHNRNIAEILSKCGCRYLYHCRGKDVPNVYRLKAPSGASVLALHELNWYIATITPECFCNYPEQMKKYGIDRALKVFGVGDHGGGPTRRDLERLHRYNQFPLMPNIVFGTFSKFFDYLEKNTRNLPEIDEELNEVFAGCYTSQSRIKAANFRGEKEFEETLPLLGIVRQMNWLEPRFDLLEEAKRIHSFNHFHDILPGSCTPNSRDYALGQAQIRDANLAHEKTAALKAIADRLAVPEDENEKEETTSMGAGSGFAAGKGIAASTPNSSSKRAYLVYNPAKAGGKRVVDLELWDYDEPLELLRVYDKKGRDLPFAIQGKPKTLFFLHNVVHLSVLMDLPPLSYATIFLDGAKNIPGFISPKAELFVNRRLYEREIPEAYLFENDLVRIEIEPDNASVVSIEDKKTGQCLRAEDGLRTGFLYQMENGDDLADDNSGMSSWACDPILETERLENIHLIGTSYRKSSVGTSIEGTLKADDFEILVRFSLNEGEPFLRIDASISYHGRGISKQRTPRLSYFVNGLKGKEAIYRIPLGFLHRKANRTDVVSLGFAGIEMGKDLFFLSARGKYGYRFYDGMLSVVLLRASTDPDPIPEYGVTENQIVLGITPNKTNLELANLVDAIRHEPLSLPILGKGGTLPLCGTLFNLPKNIFCAAIEPLKDGLRYHFVEMDGKEGPLLFPVGEKKAFLSDALGEKRQEIQTKDGIVDLNIKPFELLTLIVC